MVQTGYIQLLMARSRVMFANLLGFFFFVTDGMTSGERQRNLDLEVVDGWALG